MSEPELVERLRKLATALVVLRQGVTMKAAETLPACDPVTVADALEEAADALERLSRSDVTEDEVERVARALYEQGIVEREIAPAVARAAIAAMRSAATSERKG